MADEPLDILYLTDKLPEDVHQQIAELDGEDFRSEEVDRDFVELRYDRITKVQIFINRGEEWAWNEPRVIFSTFTKPFYTDVDVNSELHDPETVGKRVDSILEFLIDLTSVLEPEYAWSGLDIDYSVDQGPRPIDRPIVEYVDQMSWFTVFSEPLVQDLGGYDLVKDTPAWKVIDIETGHIIIVASDNPVEPTYHPDIDPASYLFSEDHGTSGSESDLDLLDPFATLDAGEYGTDVCLHRDDISTSFPNADLELIRVERDERGDLRRIEDGRFVRNVVEDAPEDEMAQIKAMLGDVPPEVDDEDLYVSTLLLEAIPPEFVRLDDPDGQNVVTRVMDLDVETNKVDLLVSLGRAAETRGDGAIESIEGALETLQEVEDVDGVEDWIDEHLLL